ncbi:hypothetical protein [Massilia sp. BSC265]|uniref:hypothetical protein n=1 Tax=Massilia sp. BSC265 TaxID=1549812 RepID=UPI00068A565F|nr:hypothetical protein [Massilia sp. BSC265]
MKSRWHIVPKLLATAPLLAMPQVMASAAPNPSADAAIRALADQAAGKIVHKDMAAVYAAMSPKLKAAYSREVLIGSLQVMQKGFGNIKEYRYHNTEHGVRGVKGEWLRIVTYRYHVKTDRFDKGTYLRVEVTQEQGRYYIAGCSMERVLIKT